MTNLCDRPPEEIVDLLEDRVETCDITVHGSGGEYAYLRPMPAYALDRDSGRQTAVYSTTAVGIALGAAVFNRPLSYATSGEIGAPNYMSFAKFGRDNKGGRYEFIFMPHIFSALAADSEHSTELLRDGYVYEIPKQSSTLSPGTRAEWQCTKAIIPPRAYRIPRTVGRLLFGNVHPRFVTRPYTRAEIEECEATFASQPQE